MSDLKELLDEWYCIGEYATCSRSTHDIHADMRSLLKSDRSQFELAMRVVDGAELFSPELIHEACGEEEVIIAVWEPLFMAYIYDNDPHGLKQEMTDLMKRQLRTPSKAILFAILAGLGCFLKRKELEDFKEDLVWLWNNEVYGTLSYIACAPNVYMDVKRNIELLSQKIGLIPKEHHGD